jgi:hypothetical protein
VLVVVVVLALLARKAIDGESDDEHEHGKTREFPDRARGRRRPLPARKAIDDESDNEHEHGKTREFPARTRGRRRPRSAGEESNRRRER